MGLKYATVWKTRSCDGNLRNLQGLKNALAKAFDDILISLVNVLTSIILRGVRSVIIGSCRNATYWFIYQWSHCYDSHNYNIGKCNNS